MSVFQEEELRRQWPQLGNAAYLNTAAHAMVPKVALEAAEQTALANMQPHTFDDSRYFEVPDRARRALARLIQGNAEDIALTTGATSGLVTLAHAIPWQTGDEILSAAGEFPVQYATWKPMERRAGIHLKMVVPTGAFLTADDIIAAITSRTRLISISHVRFNDGCLMESHRIAEACRTRGILFALDVSHACGAVPLSVADLGADMLVCAGYKWLLGPKGTGFAWIRHGLIDSLLPSPFYWSSQPTADFSALDLTEPRPSAHANRWDSAESASYFNFNLNVMAASAEFVAGLDRGMVLDHGRALIQHLFDRLPPGFSPASPIDPGERGPFGCFRAQSTQATWAVFERLQRNNIFTAMREGAIRVAPYLFNTTQEIDRLIDLLREQPRGEA